MKALIADDDPVVLESLTLLLKKWGHEVLAVTDGLDAWDILQQPDAPKLLLLDWEMPGLDGLDVCKKVRQKADKDTGYTYIIMLTGKVGKDDLVVGFDAGVDDYLTKPFDPNELKIRVRTAKRMLDLQQQLLDSQAELNKKRQQEMEIGAKIQDTLLLAQPPRRVGRLEIAAMTEASEEIGGDFFEFISQGEECLDVIVGDVMGKGVPAALLGAATKTHLVRAVNELVTNSNPRRIPSPQEVIMAVHQQMTHHMIDMGLFITVFYARINLECNRLEFVDCGHAHAMYYNKKTGETTTLGGKNMPLGFTSAETYSQNTIEIATGDILLFYSDGITDIRGRGGDFFGRDRVAKTLQREAHLQPADIIHSLLSDIIEFSGTKHFCDDLTCVAVKIN